MTTPDSPVLLEHLFRHQAGRIVARLTRLLGSAHVDLAEESMQEALLRALQTWPYQGVPDNAKGWLFRVAHNAAIDAVRRASTFGSMTDLIVAELTRSASVAPDDSAFEDLIRDDELRMIFMCSHPDIPPDARVALSLKTIGGFSVREIARAVLAEEPAIAQRLVRAKRQIRDGQLALELPAAAELPRRLDSVLEVIYLMFNEGYAAHEGADLIRHDLCFEALRLGRLVAAAPLATPRVHALVALMALQAARLPARVNEAGDLVRLEEQDRARWDARLIAINPSPIVALNRAVAIGKVHGAAEALAIVEPLGGDPKLRHYHLLLALRGELLLELGRPDEAAASFQAALACPCSEPERRFLTRKLDTR